MQTDAGFFIEDLDDDTSAARPRAGQSGSARQSRGTLKVRAPEVPPGGTLWVHVTAVGWKRFTMPDIKCGGVKSPILQVAIKGIPPAPR